MTHSNPHTQEVHDILGTSSLSWWFQEDLDLDHTPELSPAAQKAIHALLEHALDNIFPEKCDSNNQDVSGSLRASDGAVMLEYRIRTTEIESELHSEERPLEKAERTAIEAQGAQGIFVVWSGGGDSGDVDSVEWVGGPNDRKALPDELIKELNIVEICFEQVDAEVNNEGSDGRILWLINRPTDPTPEIEEFLTDYLDGNPEALIEGHMMYRTLQHIEDISESDPITIRLEQPTPSAETQPPSEST